MMAARKTVLNLKINTIALRKHDFESREMKGCVARIGGFARKKTPKFSVRDDQVPIRY